MSDGNNTITAVEVETITASEIQSKPINWLLNPYLPLGTVTVMFGDGGFGNYELKTKMERKSSNPYKSRVRAKNAIHNEIKVLRKQM
jgi:hypothetical protein